LTASLSRAIIAMNIIVYEAYKLRPLQETDKDIKFALGLHKEIRRGYGADYRIVPNLTQEMVEAWYKREVESGSWVIVYSSTPIGHCQLRDDFFRIGLWHPKFMNHGHGTNVAKMVLTYAFNHLDSQKVSLRVLDYNKIAIRSYEKAGFQFVRPLEEKVEVAGKLEQENLMEVNKEDFSNNLNISVL
jgi:RimJ/RimL family protein N-acetyltransferase